MPNNEPQYVQIGETTQLNAKILLMYTSLNYNKVQVTTTNTVL